MATGTRIWLDPESWIDYNDTFLDAAAADQLLDWSLRAVDWEERGEYRLLAWYGDFEYQYPGVSHPARAIPPELQDLGEKIASFYRDEAPGGFDGIRLNRYDSGSSYVDFHGDDEPSLVPEYPIAFLSLGRPRTLLFRSTSRTIHPGYAFWLGHASLLVMGGRIQTRWHHGVPVEPQLDRSRISLTFRKGRAGPVPSRPSQVESPLAREE